MRKHAVWMILLLLSAFLIVPDIPKTHAAGPAVVQSCNANSLSANSVNCALSLSVTAGDAIIVTFGGNFVGGGTTTISGGGLTYTQVVSQASGNIGSQIYSAPDVAGGALTVTGATTGAADQIQLIVYEVSGINPTSLATATGVCAFSCGVQNPTTSTSLATTGTFAIAALFDGGGSGPNVNPTAGFTIDFKFNGNTNELILAEWCVTCTTTTNFLLVPSGQGTNWVLSAATFGPTVFVGVIVVTPCTAYELQCWLYPSFFVSVYLLLMIAVVYRGEVSSKDMEGVALEALAIGTLIGVIIGMFSVMIPLLITIIQVTRLIRA